MPRGWKLPGHRPGGQAPVGHAQRTIRQRLRRWESPPSFRRREGCFLSMDPCGVASTQQKVRMDGGRVQIGRRCSGTGQRPGANGPRRALWKTHADPDAPDRIGQGPDCVEGSGVERSLRGTEPRGALAGPSSNLVPAASQANHLVLVGESYHRAVVGRMAPTSPAADRASARSWSPSTAPETTKKALGSPSPMRTPARSMAFPGSTSTSRTRRSRPASPEGPPDRRHAPATRGKRAVSRRYPRKE
jgi:hypothetical protein